MRMATTRREVTSAQWFSDQQLDKPRMSSKRVEKSFRKKSHNAGLTGFREIMEALVIYRPGGWKQVDGWERCAFRQWTNGTEIQRAGYTLPSGEVLPEWSLEDRAEHAEGGHALGKTAPELAGRNGEPTAHGPEQGSPGPAVSRELRVPQ